MARLPHDLFDRRAELGQRKNSGVYFFAAQIALVLKLLRGGEQCRVDERRSERGSYAAHRFTHGAEEGGTGVFHQMPAVGNLKSAGKRPAGGERKAATVISRDNGYLPLSGEPCLRCCRLPIA